MAPCPHRLRRAAQQAARLSFKVARAGVLTTTGFLVMVYLHYHMLASLYHEPDPLPPERGARSKPMGVDGGRGT